MIDIFKKIVSVLIIIFISMLRVSALNEQDISARCAVIICEDTGEIVFAKNEHKPLAMASTTKIMTSLLAVESGLLSKEIKVTESMVQVEGTSMGLLPGDSVSLNELVHGMMLKSGNDSANVCAYYLAGDLKKFALMMNDRARMIGMKNTNFVTPSGLDHELHYSTAYDMALLGREAVSNPIFLSICAKRKEVLTYGNPPYRRVLYSHNRLLDSYDGALGIKTGFTKKSGRCLVSYAKRNGAGLIAVTLNAPDDWNDHRKMLDYGFQNIKIKSSESFFSSVPQCINVVGGNKRKVSIVIPKTNMSYFKDDCFSVRILMPDFLYAPVVSGDIAGTVEVYYSDKLIKTIPLICSEKADYTETIKKNKKSDRCFLNKMKEFFNGSGTNKTAKVSCSV